MSAGGAALPALYITTTTNTPNPSFFAYDEREETT
jgi:hypothetical protein